MCLIFVGKSSDSEGFEVSSSVSNGNISGHICTPETVTITIQGSHSSLIISVVKTHK